MGARRNPQEGRLEFLTVEEAAQVLRVGRTKAYAMARQWRDTDGASGLPVIDLGSALRVPRVALEELAGGPISAPVQPRRGQLADLDAPPRATSTDARRGAPAGRVEQAPVAT